MKLTVGMLCGSLPAEYRILSGEPGTEIYRVRCIASWEAAGPLAPGTLALTAAEGRPLPPCPESCVISVAPDALADCCRRTQEILEQDYLRGKFMEGLYRASYAGAPWRHIFSACCRVMRQPLTILDYRGQILFTRLDPGTAEALNCPELVHAAMQASEPVVLPQPDAHPVLVQKAAHSGVTVGYLVVSFTAAPDCLALDMAYLKQITVMVSGLMHGNAALRPASGQYHFFLLLLQGQLSDPSAIEQRRVELQIPQHEKYYVLAVALEEDRHPSDELERTLNSILHSEIYFYCNHYVAILGREIDFNLQADNFPELLAWLAENDLYAGLSQGFLSLSGVGYAFQQCRTIVPLRKKISSDAVRFARYEDLMVGHLLQLACESGIPLTSLVHPQIVQIYNYDKEYGTEYLRTLVAFILQNRSLQMTADALFIHRNTLYYRINVLKNKFKIDFDDYRFLFKIYIAGSVYNYLGELETLSIWSPSIG